MGRIEDWLIKDITVQAIADWAFPEFKEREEKLRQQILAEEFKKKNESANKSAEEAKNEPQHNPHQDINFEFKLLPFMDDDLHLRMEELPKKLKFANKNKTILTVKKHIHNYLGESVENIEVLCKNFPVAD